MPKATTLIGNPWQSTSSLFWKCARNALRIDVTRRPIEIVATRIKKLKLNRNIGPNFGITDVTRRTPWVMIVDLGSFLENGCLILINSVPPEHLRWMRLQIELMVNREKARASGRRIDGVWYENPQPRLTFDSVSAQTTDVIDFCFGETTFGVGD